MSKVGAIMSMLLDGYVADRNDGVAEVARWMTPGAGSLARLRARASGHSLCGVVRRRVGTLKGTTCHALTAAHHPVLDPDRGGDPG
jgi:hypothetical protein